MAHEVSLQIRSKLPIGNTDVLFRAYDDDELIGTLMVSRGGIEWRSARHQYVLSARWERFDEIAYDTFPRAKRKPTARTRRAKQDRKPARRAARSSKRRKAR